MNKLYSASILLFAALLFACAPSASVPAAAPGSGPFNPATPAANAPASGPTVQAQLALPFTLHPRQSAVVTDSPNQFGITFAGVSQDSRCPTSVKCVQAGNVTVQIAFQEQGLVHPPIYDLALPPLPVAPNMREIEGYTVTLIQVQPERSSTDPIAPADYAATFVITPTNATPSPVSATPAITILPNVTPIIVTTTPTGAPTVPATTPTVAPTASGATASLDQPITLKLLNEVEIPDAHLKLQYTGVLEDSRCPKSVDCVWAGRALPSFRVEHEDQLGYFILSTQPPDARTQAYFEGYVFELKDVQPYPQNPDQPIARTDYAITVIVHQAPPPTTVNKNEPFMLKPGQSIQLADENARVTFIDVTKDSRCPYPASCFVRGDALVQAKLETADGETYTFVLHDDSGKPAERTPDTGDYSMELLNLNPYPRVDITQTIGAQDYEATFAVRKFASPPVTTPTPTPGPAGIACTSLSADDASGVLGVPVKPQAVTGIIISPQLHDDLNTVKPQGVCGFLSVERNTNDFAQVGQPRILAPEFAAYSVTAAHLTGTQTLELLRVADLVRGAAPDADATPYYLLQTQLAAGNWDAVLDSFTTLADATKNVQADSVPNLGNQALWLWRPTKASNYAAVIIETQSGFTLIEALTPPNVSKAAAQESLGALASGLTK